MDNSLIEMVARHEGFRATVYCDACGGALRYSASREAWACECKEGPCGNLTIGYGTRVDGAGITKEEGLLLLQERIGRDGEELMAETWCARLDARRYGAIIDMAYTMGVAGVKQFRGMIAALGRQDWGAAAREVDLSKWAKQAPQRAAEIAHIIEQG